MAKTKTAGTRGARKKRSGGEDMTGAKAGDVEVRTVAAADAPEFALPKPDDYEFHKKQILGYAEKKETANSHYRNALKSAQKAGIDTDALLEANKLKRSNDHAKMQRHFSQLAFALAQEGYPIQLTVHDTLLGDSIDLAYRRGFEDGENGRTLDCRYPAGSDLAAKYTRGWHHGTGKNIGQTPEQVDAVLDGDDGNDNGGDRTWPDDEAVAESGEQPAAHGSDPKLDTDAWDQQAESVVNGDAGDIERRREPELTH